MRTFALVGHWVVYESGDGTCADRLCLVEWRLRAGGGGGAITGAQIVSCNHQTIIITLLAR